MVNKDVLICVSLDDRHVMYCTTDAPIYSVQKIVKNFVRILHEVNHRLGNRDFVLFCVALNLNHLGCV